MNFFLQLNKTVNENFWIMQLIFDLLLPMFLLILGLCFAVAYLIFFERKIIAYTQERIGPRTAGPYGLLQPFADGIKLIYKEIIIPKRANRILFLLAPLIAFTLSFGTWSVIPFSSSGPIVDTQISLLFVMACMILNAYSTILGGWASHSFYSFLGAIRTVIQIISYEIVFGFIILTIIMTAGSLNLSKIVEAQKDYWFIVFHFPLAVIFFIISLAKTNRTPFDLPTAESELVSGIHVEYSSIPFALFSSSEYCSMILMSTLNVILFFGGWLAPTKYLEFIPSPIWLALKISFFLFCFIWIRASLPRLRSDQLISLSWKILLPWSLAWMICSGIILRCCI